MPAISWTSIGVLILASFQLISIFKFLEFNVCDKKAYTLQVLTPILCSAITVYLLLLVPQTFSVLLVLAVAGATKIVLLATNKLKNFNFNETKTPEERTVCAEPAENTKPLPTTLASNCNNETNQISIDIDNKQPPIPDAKYQVPEYQDPEQQHLQNRAYLHQKLINATATANRKNSAKDASVTFLDSGLYQNNLHRSMFRNKSEQALTSKSCNIDSSSPSIFQNFLTHQVPSGKSEQLVMTKPLETGNHNDDIKVCLDKIDEQKRYIESLLNQLNIKQENDRVPSPQSSGESSNSSEERALSPVLELKESYDKNQQSKTELSPFLRTHLVTSNKAPGSRLR